MQKLEWKTCFKVGFSIFCLYLCIHYWTSVANFIGNCLSAAAPFFIGCIMAYPINILMSFYERHYFPKSTKSSTIKSRRPVCLIFAIFTLVAFIAVVIGLVVPQIISCFSLLVAEVPMAITNLINYLNGLEFVPDDIIETLSSIDWKSIITQAYEFIKSGFSSVVDVVVTTVSSVVSVVFSGFLGIIFALYILLSKDKLFTQVKRISSRYIKAKWLEKINYVLSILNDTFHKFIVGQCTEAVILGVLCIIGMTILRLPYAPMIGALTALMALVPIIGAFISGAVGAFLIFMESPVKALIFLIFIVVLQQIEGNLIYPKVVGSSIGLPALWVLTAVTIGGSVAGIAGMLIAVPLAATFYRLVKLEMSKAENEKADGEITEAEGSAE